MAELPPLSLVVYHVTKASVGSAHRSQYIIHRRGNTPTIKTEHFKVSHLEGLEAAAPLSLSNKHIQIWSSPETGLLQVRPFKLKVCLDILFLNSNIFHKLKKRVCKKKISKTQ